MKNFCFSKKHLGFLSLAVFIAVFLHHSFVYAKSFFSRSTDQTEGQYYLNRGDTVGYQENITFAVPPYLRPAVDFWRKVYTQYTTKQSVIHDNLNLQIIYTAIDFTDLYANKNISDHARRKIRERKEEEVKNKYRFILHRLDRVDMEELKYEDLNQEEKRVYFLFKDVNEAYRFDKARRRLRSQVGQKDEFIRGIVDSGGFIAEMEEIFRSYRVPVQLVRLAFVESMFNTKAYSKAHASGIYQFIPSTGRQYMRIDTQIDERNDPILATHAAARLLLKNYQTLEDWPIATTAYNHGGAGMKRAIEKTGERNLGAIIENYRHRNFGFASRNFYAQFLAAVHTERFHEKYFGPLVRMQPVEHDTVRLPDLVTLKTLSDYCRIPEDELIDLNPAFTDVVINSLVYIPNDFDLKIPKGSQKDFLIAYANIPKDYRKSLADAVHWHRVKRHEVLSKIAGQYRISVGHLMQINGLTSANRIYVGQLLKIPAKAKAVPNSNLLADQRRKPVVVARAPKAKVQYPTIKVLPLQTEDPDEETKTPLVLAGNDGKNPNDSTLTPAEKVAQAIVEDQNQKEIPKDPMSEENLQKSATLYALIDPQNNQKDFSLAVPNQTDPEEVSWKFHYKLHNTKAQKDVPFAGTTIVLDGETPGHLAEWCRISTPQFRRLNQLKFNKGISLGQKVRLDCLSSYDELHQERLVYHQEIQKQFFQDCPSIQVDHHSVKANENLWELANKKYQTPIWLIQKYNPTKDLTKGIDHGENLKIPTCQANPEKSAS